MRTAAFFVSATLLLAGCGNSEDPPSSQASEEPSSSSSPSEASADTSLGEGAWLLALNSAGGADAENATTTYITYDPSTGLARARKLPEVSTPSAGTREGALLVSANRRWAIQDTSVPRAEQRSGKLTLYSLTSQETKVIDIRQRTGDSSIKALGWAFDPEQAEALRVVDARSQVWSVNVSGGPAVKSGTLPRGEWIFGDGFNPNTGEPYAESITTEDTNPPGNGEADTSQVARDGGTVLASDSEGLAALPTSPCRLAAAFAAGDGTTWTFCADSASMTAFYLPDGAENWSSFGQPSNAVAPEAAGFVFALPPQE